MALKAILDTIDGLPDPIRAEYKEQDGKFVLDIDGIDTHPGTLSLKNALERVRTEKKQEKDKREALEARFTGVPDDFDAAKYQEMANQLASSDPAKIDERLNKLRDEKEREKQTEIDKREGRINKLDGALKRTLIDGGLTKALLDAGVDRPYIPAAKALLKERGKVRLIEDGDEFVVVADDGVDEKAPLDAYVKKWAQSDEGKPMLAKASGGGAGGGEGSAHFTDNPWAEKTRNLTKQQELVAANPEKARAMARAAGVVPSW